MKPPPFAYARPTSLDEALGILAGPGDPLPLAGGQSLVPMLNMRLVRPDTIVDLSRLPTLNGIEAVPSSVTVGARVTHHDLARHRALSPVAALPRAVSEIGFQAIRHRGTLGGAWPTPTPPPSCPPSSWPSMPPSPSPRHRASGTWLQMTSWSATTPPPAGRTSCSPGSRSPPPTVSAPGSPSSADARATSLSPCAQPPSGTARPVVRPGSPWVGSTCAPDGSTHWRPFWPRPGPPGRSRPSPQPCWDEPPHPVATSTALRNTGSTSGPRWCAGLFASCRSRHDVGAPIRARHGRANRQW